MTSSIDRMYGGNPAHDFEIVNIPRPGTPIPARGIRVTCSKCGVTAERAMHGNARAAGQRQAEKLFANSGWRLGSHRGKDLCPTCSGGAGRFEVVAGLSIEKANGVNHHPKENRIVADANGHGDSRKVEVLEGLTMKAPPVVAAEPPREMGRTEKRIIWAKLEEVYLDEKRGYSAGWTDETVAKDLGVPRAWVAAVRDEGFGPLGADETTLAEVSAMRAYLADQRKELASKRADFEMWEKGVLTRLNAFDVRIVKLENLYRK